METGPVLALLLMVVVHVVGIAVLIALMGREVLDVFRSRPRDWDDDGGDPPGDEPVPAPQGGGGGLPLPGAAQGAVRLRERGRIADGYPRPARRPAREPDPVRQPEQG